VADRLAAGRGQHVQRHPVGVAPGHHEQHRPEVRAAGPEPAALRPVVSSAHGADATTPSTRSSEMPHTIEEVFATCGLSLFPVNASELEMSCSCPDWAVPCKHIAATFYLLAEAFDRRFWSPRGDLAACRRRSGTAAAAPDLLLLGLEPPDVQLGGRRLEELLAPAYHAMTQAWMRIVGAIGNTAPSLGER
jgi:hypothetical protein